MASKRKRSFEELEEQRRLYGHGKKWFRGSIIGEASSGPVYLATLKKPKWRLTHLPALMAVKSAEFSDSALLRNEAIVLKNLQGCPYICKYYGDEIITSTATGYIYNLLLEYGSGGTLAGLIKKSNGRGLPESDVRRYTRYILEGLDFVHGRGYTHCDLKPENVIMVPFATNSGTKYMAKITDFGLAKGRFLRDTLRYLSPEAVACKLQKFASDIWALGCVVIEMLTGKSMWDGKKDSEVEDILSGIGKAHELPKLPYEVSKEAKEFLMGCFASKPEERLTAKKLLNQSFVARLDQDSEENEEPVDGSEEKVCSAHVTSLMTNSAHPPLQLM